MTTLARVATSLITAALLSRDPACVEARVRIPKEAVDE